MDIVTLGIEVFGVASLLAAFVKYTIDKKKFERSHEHHNNPLRRF